MSDQASAIPSGALPVRYQCTALADLLDALLRPQEGAEGEPGDGPAGLDSDQGGDLIVTFRRVS